MTGRFPVPPHQVQLNAVGVDRFICDATNDINFKRFRVIALCARRLIWCALFFRCPELLLLYFFRFRIELKTLLADAFGPWIRLFGAITHRPREQYDAMAVLVRLRNQRAESISPNRMAEVAFPVDVSTTAEL